MGRLTKQIDLEELGYDYVLLDETKQPSANYKLGQLEDYEDKFKIDLLKGLEAMYKGCYAYYAIDKEPAFIEPDDIEIMRGGIAVGFYPEEWNHNKRMSGQMCRFGCPVENYGKTWALTKEELL